MQALGDAWLGELEQWSIRDQISLPYLLWREEIVPGTFGIDQLENDIVAWIPHAQEVRDHRRTVLALESRSIHLVDDLRWVRADLEVERELHERLAGRRAVRLALAVAAGAQPLVKLLRRARSAGAR